MCITKTANYNHSIITALNGRLQNWCSQTLKCLHQLLCKQESPRKCCSFGRKVLWKPPYQGSGSESLKCFAPKMSKRAEALMLCLHSPSRTTWTLNACLVQVGDTIKVHFCCMRRAYCCLSTHLDRLFLPFIYLQDFVPQYQAFTRGIPAFVQRRALHSR